MIKRILVPVDFSAPSMQALDYAVDFGKPFNPEFVVIFVVELAYYADPSGLTDTAGMVLNELERFGHEQLGRLAANLSKRHVTARTVLQIGTPSYVIVEMAKRLRADLIIMSTHGRTGLSHLLIGSVAEKVVRSATCPVLTVRGEGPSRRPSRPRAGGRRRPARHRTGRAAAHS